MTIPASSSAAPSSIPPSSAAALGTNLPANLPAIDRPARQKLVETWLQTLADPYQLSLSTLQSASSDASFRRYFRVSAKNEQSYVVMDAPPTHEDVRPFVRVAELFAASGVTVPQVLEKDEAQGLLLLRDLGHQTYLDVLTPENAPTLYQAAMHALIKIQQGSQTDILPVYDRTLLLREMALFPEWYVGKHCQTTLSEIELNTLTNVFEVLLTNNLGQSRVVVHRDYHSRNLMYLNSDENPGVLDFQDAVYGPITYDLVSLVRDAYIEWPEEQVIDWVVRYWEQAKKAGLPVPTDPADFYRDFEWMGLQRHLKVLGIFARLAHRDGKTGYLKDLPLVLKYTRKVAERYSAFFPLLRLLDHLEGATAAYTF